MSSSQAMALKDAGTSRGSKQSRSQFRAAIDQWVLEIFRSKVIQRQLREQTKVNLDAVWHQTLSVTAGSKDSARKTTLEQSDVHRIIVEGLPGEALYISAAMAFDSMQEALPFFEVSAKTARLRIGELLPISQGEIALRIGRVLKTAGDVLGSLDAARAYLRTQNFALGGAIPRDLLRTAEGEQLVLSELQTQAAGGPV